MGTDIHMHREVRDSNGSWRVMGDVYRFFNPLFEDSPEDFTGITCGGISRDYDLFGLLAGVRYNPDFVLCDCVGLPEDVSAEVGLSSEEWDSDGHSHGYATLAELDAFKEMIRGKLFDEGKPFELDYFFEGWVDQKLRPWAWAGSGSVRIVFWFDN